MNGTERVRPSSWYYLLAVAAVASGLGLMIYMLVSDIHRIRDSMVRWTIPGQIDLELKQSETYTVFAEGNAAGNAGPFSFGNTLRGVSCEVHLLPSGETIQPNGSAGTTTYTYGARRGVSILEFNVPHDGTYTVACADQRTITEPKLEAAIGGGTAKAISGIMARAFVFLMGGIVVGVLIFVRVVMLRLESRREIREQGLKPV
jgi:hypothetical protein